jgi:hypothetical protein
MAKQQKYAVFSIADLNKMMTHAKRRSGGTERTVILKFESAGKRWPGQLWFKGMIGKKGR